MDKESDKKLTEEKMTDIFNYRILCILNNLLLIIYTILFFTYTYVVNKLKKKKIIIKWELSGKLMSVGIIWEGGFLYSPGKFAPEIGGGCLPFVILILGQKSILF